MNQLNAAFYEGTHTIRIGECTPVPPGPSEVQIQVSYCGICGTDLHVFHGAMDHRVHIPQVLGHEMAGTIIAHGSAVQGFAPGDRVTVRPLVPCGDCPACRAGHSHICHNLKFIGIDAPGALQGLWTVPAHTLHRLPDSVSLEHGALIEPIAVACHDVRLGEVAKDDYVVVLGGGPIGLLVGLVAQNRGARVVVGEINAFRTNLAREFGLDAVNPQEIDLLQKVMDDTGGAGADVVFEVSGSPAGAEMLTQLPRVRGRIVVVAIFSKPPKIDLFRFFWRELQLRGARVYEPEDFEAAIALVASAKLPLDRLVTAVRPLESLMQAMHELEAGGPVMKILMRCSES
jgi:2-desacetyl-2-hydroxyethyl bacteriochlorophyllide A dehydrogenase